MDKKVKFFGHIHKKRVLLQSVLCWLVWTTLVGLVYSLGCAPQLPESQVARMCYESVAAGSTVYIDTAGAKATDNSSGPLCFCNATVANAKFVNVRVQGQNSACGSKLRFSFTNKQVESDENKCLSTKHLVQIQQKQLIDVVLEKIHQPYYAEFCTKIEIQRCGENEYQCDTTADCIARTNVCDNFPDCSYGDDETECGNGVCTEGQVECRNGTGCYSNTDRCNNHTECADGSDEDGCFVELDKSDTVTEAWNTDPVITIQCFESGRFSTTTTTTTTTTTATTTTTPPTTTTTTTTTTTPSTTTTTMTTPTTTITTPSTTTSSTTLEITTATPTTTPESDDVTSKTNNKTTTTKSTGASEQSHMPTYVNKPDTNNNEGITSTLKKPYVIAGIVLGAVVLVGAVTCIALAARRKMKKSKSKNISPDLWIPDKGEGEKELEPLNT